MSLRLVFMGTPAFAVPTLDALAANGHDIAAVYSQPPKPAGRRGLALTPSPVHRRAEELELAVRTPKTLRDAAEQEAFRALKADAAVVVAYGMILPPAILEALPLGAWNGHASRLPRWRGAAPIQRAIMAGDTETAMTVMKMEAGLDTGPVALEEVVPIGPLMTAGELHDRLSARGGPLMAEAMRRLARGDLSVTPQPDAGVTYAAKIDKAEARIDWAEAASMVHDRIRGLSPFPGAWCEIDFGAGPERVKVLRSEPADGSGIPGTLLDDRLSVACGDGAVRLLELQRAGGKALAAEAFLRGAPLPAGMRIG